jgi:hypothetical protein
MKDELITIVGSSYFDPISVLLDELEKYDEGQSNEVQSGNYVNGFSSSICILSVVCLESYVMRVRYINKATQNDIDKTPVPVYLKKLYLDFPYEQELNEVHVVRDVLAHNHLWEVSFSWSEKKGMIHNASSKRSSGDKKYKQYVDSVTNTTSKLGLNVNPIKIGVSDAKTVIQTVWRILLFLESKNRNQCYVSHLRVNHKQQMMRFGEVIGLPETCT